MIAGAVVAVTDVATQHHDAVRAFAEGAQDQLGGDAPAARHPDDLDIRRIFHAGHAGGIGAAVGTPVAQKSDDSSVRTLRHLHRFEGFHHLHSSDHLRDQLVIGEVLEADGFGQAGTHAGATALAQGFVDMRFPLSVNELNCLVRT